MADRKTERLMNLIFTLLVTRQYLSKEQIRQAIADYRASTQVAFERKFERDKEELRELGIAVETGTNDKYFDDEPGYRIRRDAAELPDLDLTREEAAVLGLAAQVWEHAGLATSSTSALVKLKAAGVAVDTDVLRMAEPKLSAHEPAFEAALDAATRRIPVRFEYRRPGAEATQRRVLPWRILSWRGRWYLVGHDVDRDAPRMFRLSRVVGDLEHDGEPGAFERPAEEVVSAAATALFPRPSDRTARLSVATARANALRRSAASVTPGDDGRDELVVPFSTGWDLAAEIASYGPDVVVLDPPELRDQVIGRLRAVLEATGAAS
ncbi:MULTISPECIES: YafY family protein [unclassified Aeromicrobium]|uniref:helix-turn-helix transcriptional regulator n=1 Tax=unclassified Aeromicrobium TaxID=2633570 RepID=UPI0006FF7DCB|nr:MULTISPECIES: WYL domain-containing protein [unclassified Aeromicrobium]KQO39087.1 transcriptional regulator [Aeromicrobium sp. Leaf245]KQP24943.1 transcriptional regulator [Aeromicrobium sp. Leaf272]KQP79555.1 transcriptional regulator [Aeromicrobium sp. Leaf289]KQP82353.1 transcriptional regulator [Aeromicrobium sp. Leaf291]